MTLNSKHRTDRKPEKRKSSFPKELVENADLHKIT